MRHERNRLLRYCSRLVGGLVAAAVVAVSLHRDVAAVAILAVVVLLVLAITSVTLRDGDL